MIEMAITEMTEITDLEMVDMILDIILGIIESIYLIQDLIEKVIGKEQTIHTVLVVDVINKTTILKINSLTEIDHSEVAPLVLTDLIRFQAMTDTLHNLVDDSCNLLELQEQYTESLNC